MTFSKQEFWIGLHVPSLGDLPDPGIKFWPSVSPALAGRFFTPEPPGKPLDTVVCVLSHFSGVRLSGTPWTTAFQPPVCIEFSRQEYWSELPFPTMGDLPDPGNKLEALMSPALAGGFFTTTTTWEAAETTLVLLYHPPPGSSDPGPCTSHSPGS